MRSIVFVGALVILFLIGSRTAFAVFGLTGLVFLVIASLRVTLVFAAVTVLTLVLCAVALGLFSSSVDVDQGVTSQKLRYVWVAENIRRIES